MLKNDAHRWSARFRNGQWCSRSDIQPSPCGTHGNQYPLSEREAAERERGVRGGSNQLGRYRPYISRSCTFLLGAGVSPAIGNKKTRARRPCHEGGVTTTAVPSSRPPPPPAVARAASGGRGRPWLSTSRRRSRAAGT